ncbi:MAG TPA: PAS domain S-box protein [Chitinophagaceae bacterium]|nr:PAS domain S-box protein [Chitinophagaceae bacterium]
MQKKAASTDEELNVKTVTVFVSSRELLLSGDWSWDLSATSVYCSDVMLSLPNHFEGTKGIIHPDDVSLVTAALSASEIIEALDFRIITSYGEVKTLSGKSLSSSPPEQVNHPDLLLHKVHQETEEKRAAKRARLTRTILASAERMFQYACWYYNLSTNEVWYSDHVYRLHGLPAQALNAHLDTFLSFVHPDDQRSLQEAFDSSLERRLPLHIEYRILKNGEERWLRQLTSWEFSDTGELILSGILHDVTEEKRVEQEFQSAEDKALLQSQLLRFAEQSTATGYWHINLLTRKVVFSEQFYRIYGLKHNAVAASSNFLINYVHPDDRDAVLEASRTIRTMHTPPDLEFRLVRNDGKVRMVRLRGKAITNAGSEIIMAGVLQDVTVQKTNEKKITGLHEQLLVKNFAHWQSEGIARLGSWVWEIASGEITWSENLHDMLGFKASAVQLTQHHLQRAIHPEDRKKFTDSLNLMLTEKVEGELEFRLIRLGEQVYMKAWFRLMKYLDKDYFIATVQDISKERNIQRQLSERLQLAEALTETIPDRVFITDGDNAIVLWNKKCETHYKQKKDQVLKRNYFDVFPHLKDGDTIENFNKVLKGQPVHELNRRLGNEYFDLHMFPLKNDEGDIIGILHLLHDTTTVYELNQRVNERLSFIDNLVESSVDRIIALDKNMNYLLWNKQCEKHFGILKEEVIGKNILEVFPPSISLTYDHFKKALKGESIRIDAADSSSEDYSFETFLLPVKNDRDQVTAVLWIMHDLSKEDRLLSEHKRAFAILDMINEACVEISNEGKLLYANAKAEQFWNMKKEDLLNKNVWEVFPQAVDTPLYFAINFALQEKQPVSQEFESTSQKKRVSFTATPTEAGIVVLFVDISDKKH